MANARDGRNRRGGHRRRDPLLRHDDGRSYTGQEINDELVGILTQAGIHPALVHATKVTGLMVTKMNMHLLDEEDIDEWNAAVEEGEALYGSIPPS